MQYPDGEPSSNAYESSAFSHLQVKSRELWIGSVEVRPLNGCEVFDYSQAAFVNIVTWAADAFEYAEKAGQVLAEKHLFVVEIESAEPVRAKREKHGEFEASVAEIIAEAERNPQTTFHGEFFTYLKTDS